MIHCPNHWRHFLPFLCDLCSTPISQINKLHWDFYSTILGWEVKPTTNCKYISRAWSLLTRVASNPESQSESASIWYCIDPPVEFLPTTCWQEWWWKHQRYERMRTSAAKLLKQGANFHKSLVVYTQQCQQSLDHPIIHRGRENGCHRRIPQGRGSKPHCDSLDLIVET